jgi:hypothetical protein
MRARLIIGLVLAAAGVYLILRPPSYSSQQSVFKLGTLEASVQERRPVPAWVGGILIGAGSVLVLLGLGRSQR